MRTLRTAACLAALVLGGCAWVSSLTVYAERHQGDAPNVSGGLDSVDGYTVGLAATIPLARGRAVEDAQIDTAEAIRELIKQGREAARREETEMIAKGAAHQEGEGTAPVVVNIEGDESAVPGEPVPGVVDELGDKLLDTEAGAYGLPNGLWIAIILVFVALAAMLAKKAGFRLPFTRKNDKAKAK